MKEFDQAAFWRDRVTGHTGLNQVGHRAMGEAYNRWIYQRRLEVLNVLDQAELSVGPEVKVLDLGCGSGFYVAYWQAKGVAQLAGLDLSVENIATLQQQYPDYQFFAADVTKRDAPTIGEFELVTLFDVLYHIVDDAAAAAAIEFVHRHLAANGTLLIFDQLLERDYSLRQHVKFRDRRKYMRMLAAHNLKVVEEIPLFLLLHPPVFGIRAIDYLVAAAYVAVGLMFKSIPCLGAWAGRLVYRIDTALFECGARIPNQMLLVVRRVKS